MDPWKECVTDVRHSRGDSIVGTRRATVSEKRALAPVQRADRGRVQLTASSAQATRTPVRLVPRGLQPKQRAVPVRRRWTTRRHAAVRPGHASVRFAGAGPVVLPVHEHHADYARKPVRRSAGRVLLDSVGFRARRLWCARPRRSGRRDGLVRPVWIRARVVLSAVFNGFGLRTGRRCSWVRAWWRNGHRIRS